MNNDPKNTINRSKDPEVLSIASHRRSDPQADSDLLRPIVTSRKNASAAGNGSIGASGTTRASQSSTSASGTARRPVRSPGEYNATSHSTASEEIGGSADTQKQAVSGTHNASQAQKAAGAARTAQSGAGATRNAQVGVGTGAVLSAARTSQPAMGTASGVGRTATQSSVSVASGMGTASSTTRTSQTGAGVAAGTSRASQSNSGTAQSAARSAQSGAGASSGAARSTASSTGTTSGGVRVAQSGTNISSGAARMAQSGTNTASGASRMSQASANTASGASRVPSNAGSTFGTARASNMGAMPMAARQYGTARPAMRGADGAVLRDQSRDQIKDHGIIRRAGSSVSYGASNQKARAVTGTKYPAKNSSKNGAKKGSRRTGDQNGKGDSTALSSLVKAIIYITCILIVSGTLGFFGISMGNDIFAFVKDDFETSIVVSDSTTITEIADILHDKGVIKYPKMFKLYADIRKKTWKCNAGEYTVSPSMNYDTLLTAFRTKEPERTTVRVTIPEGYTIDEMIDLFVEKYHIGTREGFVDAIQNGEYDYWFVNELSDLPEGRKYRLEGYLYPDTYDYYSTAKPETVIAKMLQNFDVKMRTILGKDWENTCKQLCKERGMSFDQIVTLASMIQMEAKYEYEYEDISAVFMNRLKNTTVSGGRLQSDATIQYFLEERNADLTQADLDNPNLYNTYLYAGLPPGPITNITINAINYAFYPSDNGYYFFYGHPDGYTMFAKTYAEHQQNIAIAKEAAAKKNNKQ